MNVLVDDNSRQEVVITHSLSARSIGQDITSQELHVIIVAWFYHLFTLPVYHCHLSIIQLDNGKIPLAIYKFTVL